MPAVIGALHFHGIDRLFSRDHQTIVHRHGDDVSQVILALDVVVRQAIEPLAQVLTRHRKNAGVAFGDQLLRFGRVFVLNDRKHLTLSITHDAPITRGIRQGNGQQRHFCRANLFQQALQGLHFNQRHIAVQNQHGIGCQRRHRLSHGMPSSQLLVLQHKVQVVGRQAFANDIGTMADDNVNALWIKLTGTVDNMPKHGISRHGMENLRQRRAHARALTCGENNDIE